MSTTLERVEPTDVGRKKSETRKHTAMMRVDSETLDRAKLAASMMRMSLADWSSAVLARAADRDIAREARKLAKGSGDERTGGRD